MDNAEENQTNEKQTDEEKKQEEEECNDNLHEYSFYKKLERTLKEQANQKKKQINKEDNNVKLKAVKINIPIVGQTTSEKSTFLNTILVGRNRLAEI